MYIEIGKFGFLLHKVHRQTSLSGRPAAGGADKGEKSSPREMTALFSEAGKKRITFSLFRVSAGLVNSVERSGTAIN